MAYDNNLFCDFNSTATKAVAGKDILLAIFNADGSKLLAIAGQQGLTINRSKDNIEVTSKDTKGGWKSKIGGMKEWSIDNDGLYVPSDESHKLLAKAFEAETEEDEFICVKVIDAKRMKSMFGGLAIITDYSIEAPFDDSMTYSISLEGNGALVDLSDEAPGEMPGASTIKEYTQEELEKMTKAKIAEIALSRGYTTVSEDDLKAAMITAFLAAQGA